MIHEDPRFLRGVELFNEQEYFDASEEFEELFFEAIRGEVEFIRIFLQVSVGMVHAERKQYRPAIERLGEAVKAIDRTLDARGYDLEELREGVLRAIVALGGKDRAPVMTLRRQA